MSKCRWCGEEIRYGHSYDCPVDELTAAQARIAELEAEKSWLERGVLAIGKTNEEQRATIAAQRETIKELESTIAKMEGDR